MAKDMDTAGFIGGVAAGIDGNAATEGVSKGVSGHVKGCVGALIGAAGCSLVGYGDALVQAQVDRW